MDSIKKFMHDLLWTITLAIACVLALSCAMIILDGVKFFTGRN